MNIIYVLLILLGFFILSSLYRHKRKRNKVINVVEDNCVGCQYCVKRCQHKVLEMKRDEDGYNIAFVKNPHNCTACGDCIKKCKFNALQLQPIIMNLGNNQ
jgi:NAD-dependent dihydropyrimidine dehydrogenase PreA subunit